MTNRKFNVVPTKATIVPADLVVLIDSEDGMKLKQASATSFVGPAGSTGPAGADGVVQTLIAGTNISVNLADPANPIVSLSLGADDNFVTDAEKTVIGNTSGTNTGDQDLSGLQTTLISGTNIKTINGTTILGSGDLEITAGSGGYSANVFLTTLTSAVVPAHKQTSYTPEVAETLVSGTANNNTVLIQSYVFDLPLGVTSIDAGTWEFHPTYYVNSATGDTRMIFDVYSRTTGGTETLLFTRTSDEINNTTRDTFTIQSTQSAFSVNATDYLVIKISVSTTSTSNKTLTYVVGDGEATHLITPLVLRHNQLRARDATDSHPASAITNTPAGNIIATTVQDAINELDTEKAKIAGDVTQAFSASSIELGNASDCTLSRSAAGKLAVEGVNVGTEGILVDSVSADYTIVQADNGRKKYHPSSDTTARTWTLSSGLSSDFTVTLINDTSAGAITIVAGSDALVYMPTGATGNRTLAANGMCTITNMTTIRKAITGVGLT